MIHLHVYECKNNTKAFSRQKLLDNLAQYLGKNSQEIIVSHNENGKPHVNGIYFSVSHCRDKIVQVFTKEADIGIDVEFKNPKRSFLNLAQRYFHPFESECLNNLASADAMHLFYNLWTAKEAVCKAHGGRLWYYLAENYLTKNLNMSPVIKGMNLQFLNKLADYSLSIASSGTVENIINVENV